MDQNPPKESRPPINLRIKFRSESIEQFIERYAVDVSRGGIFIRTREPLAVGTQLKLDFQFQNGTALMAGDGTVVWIREFDPNRTSVPPGMGVRFDKLTAESQAVLEQLLVEKAKRERGGIPGSGNQGAGGIAVRRPSSMFSVLEPQAAGAQTTSGSATQQPPLAPATTQPPAPLSPLAAVTAQLTSELQSKTSLGTSQKGARHDAAPSRPAGAARNSFAASEAPASSARSSAPEDSAPFDDINDEPTQIAGRLPSFLLSDDDATAVASGLTSGPSARPKDPALHSRVALPGQPGIRKADPLAAPPQSTEPVPPLAGDLVGWNAALDQLLPSDQPTAASPPTAQKESAPSGIGGSAATADVAPSIQPQTGAPGAAVVSSTVASGGGTTAAKAAADRRRSPAALIGLSVVVLAAVAIFLVRFFASQATETAPSSVPSAGSSASSGPASAPAEGPGATVGPGTTAEPVAPAPAPTVKDPAAPGTAATPATQEAAESPPRAQRDPAPPSDAPGAAAAPGSAEPSIRRVTGKRRIARAPGDTTAEGTSPTAVKMGQKPAEPAPAAGAVPLAAAPAAAPGAKADEVTKTDVDAPAYQVRVTSKPDGADVTMDGQTVGRTPYSGGIGDITAPHFIAVRKEGFEPFEQMISSSSAWTKPRVPNGSPVVQTLKINARLKPIPGAAAATGVGAGPSAGVGSGEGSPATQPPAASTDPAAKTEGAKTERPIPPADDHPATESPPK